MQKLIKNPEFRKLLDLITLKKVKTEIGHDFMGYYCDVYLTGVKGKIGYVNNDGWGGHVEVEYDSKEKKEIFETFLKGGNVAQLMFETDWGFMKDVKKIDLDCQALCVVEEALNYRDEKKFEQKRAKAFEKGIVFGTDDSYTAVKFKSPLKAVAMIKGGKEIIQREVDKIKAKLKPNQKIFNTNLEELGIKV